MLSAVIAAQRARAVRDQGPGGAGHRSLPHPDHRAQAAAGHRASGTSILRLCAHAARGVHLARDLRRNYHHLHREPALPPAGDAACAIVHAMCSYVQCVVSHCMFVGLCENVHMCICVAVCLGLCLFRQQCVLFMSRFMWHYANVCLCGNVSRLMFA